MSWKATKNVRKNSPEKCTQIIIVHILGTIRDFLVYMKDNLLRERLDLFMQGDSVRPGILVLVNDTDWELLGELDYELQQNDNISFISTLHGG